MDQATCALHPILEEQIMQLAQQLHDTKMAILRIMLTTCSAITAIVGAGVWC